MFCCLCLRASDYCNDLYNINGHPTDVHKISILYFEDQICSMDPTSKSSQFLCENCWKHIREFYDFQKSIIEEQKQLEQLTLQPFEKILKPEVDIDTYNTIEEVVENVNKTDDADESFNYLHHESEEDNHDIVINSKRKEKSSLTINIRRSQRLLHKENFSHGQSEEENCIDNTNELNYNNMNKNKNIKKNKKQLVNAINKNNRKDKIITNEAVDVSVEQKTKKKRMLEMDEFIAEHWKDTFKCDKCDNFECNTFAEMRKHFRVNHPKMKAYVMCCETKFMRSSFFVDHLKWHMNPNIFQCNECGKSFMFRASYEFHKKCVHIEETEKFECEVCKKKFKGKSILKEHMVMHGVGNKDYVCEHCNKGFVLKNRYKNHIRSVHNDRSVCELCGKSIRFAALKQHLLEHDGVEKQKWSCDLCDAQLNTKHSLLRHKRVTHHDGSTCYVCGECGKISMSLESLRGHKRYVHEKERSFKCNICDKAFKKPYVLKEHMTTHTGQDLYKCPHCPKKFRVSANMHHHRKRVHPVEWAANRRHRRNLPITSNTDITSIKSSIQNEVVI